MRLLFVADIHYSLKQYDWLLSQGSRYDVVVIGGDLLDLSSPLDQDVQIAVVERYLGLLCRNALVAVSSGNHDGDSRNSADESVATWIQDIRSARIHVDGEGFDAGSTRITVCPWWDGDLSRSELDALLEREASLPHESWIWIYHAPPEGSKTCWSGRKYIGDSALREWIARHQPTAVLSGHIHNSPFYDQGSWIDRIGTTWVFNPGRQIGPEPATIVLDLDAMTAEWSSQEGRSVQDLGVTKG